MKYNLETTQKETQGFISLISRFFDIMERAQNKKHKIDKEKLGLEREKLEFEKQKWDDEDDSSEEDTEDEDSEWERPEPFLAFDAEKKKKRKHKKSSKMSKPIPPDKKVVQEMGYWGEKDLSNHQKLGKQILNTLLETWLINWGIQGQQPNRFEALHDLAIDSKKGGALVSYCMAVKGLSVAVHNVLVLLDDAANPVRSRDIAANITQVASTVFSQLADQYKYPNPIGNFTTLSKEAKENESI